jgi:predicted DCC family thiol-disulfide oxidoreductase YuxK
MAESPGVLTLDTSLHPVVLFDGVCNLCSATVQFVIKRDPRARFRFGALQSPEGAALLTRAMGRTLTAADPPDSLLLIEDDRLYARSSAVLRIVRKLRFPWPLLYACAIVPRAIRDSVYDLIARRRYRWFGRQGVCMVPTAELRSRFISPEAWKQ